MWRKEVNAGSWWGNLRERDQLEDLGTDYGIILKWIFKTWNGVAWTVLMWIRIWAVGGRL